MFLPSVYPCVLIVAAEGGFVVRHSDHNLLSNNINLSEVIYSVLPLSEKLQLHYLVISYPLPQLLHRCRFGIVSLPTGKILSHDRHSPATAGCVQR